MKKIFNINGFEPFERQQFENYLNDMAQKGYHLKKFNGIFNKYSFGEEKKGYYHVAVHGEVSLIDSAEDYEYIELFESDGYQYIDKFDLFYVFFSDKKDSIYTDKEIEEEMIRQKTIKQMFMKFVSLISITAILFIFGFFPLSFESLTTTYKLSYVLFIPILFILIVLSSLFSIHYLITKQARYDYQVCLLRGYLSSFFCMLMVFGSCFLTRTILLYGLSFVILCPCIAIIIMLWSCHKKQPLNIHKYTLITVIIFAGLSVGGFLETWNKTYKQPHLSIASAADLNVEEHSLILDYYHYVMGMYDEVDYVRCFYENMSDYVLNQYLNQYSVSFQKTTIEDCDIYQADHIVVIYKNGQIVKANPKRIKDLNIFLKELE